MYWHSWSDFIAMGGYGFYVWGSVGVTAVLLTLEPILIKQRQRNTIARLKRQFRADRQADATPANTRGNAQ
jgi:heme exporter protein D